jgi:glutamate carboxypeptidase
VAVRALCQLNVRVDNQGQQEAVEQSLAALAAGLQSDGIRIEQHGRFHAPPKPLTAGVEWLLQQLADCGRQLGIPVAWKPTGGTCDGNRLAAAGVPTVDSLGVRGGEIHSEREFMLVESLTERARLVALFLVRLAGGEITMETQFARNFAETRA